MTRKVLIIDDEKPTREFIRKMLESFDLKLEIYTDGESVQSGIEAIENLKPDIVLLDIQMPDGNGFDVLKGVSNKSFEIIFITAYQEFAVQAIKFSALDYILKPIDAEELKNAVINALQLLSHKKDDQQIQALQNNIQPHLKRKLVLKTQESIFVVEIDDIVHCEADKNYTFFYFNFCGITFGIQTSSKCYHNVRVPTIFYFKSTSFIKFLLVFKVTVVFLRYCI